MNSSSRSALAVVAILAEHFGYEDDEMHEALKFKFLRKGRTDLPTVASTTTLDTVDFSDYIERVRRWAVDEEGIVIPEPNGVEL